MLALQNIIAIFYDMYHYARKSLINLNIIISWRDDKVNFNVIFPLWRESPIDCSEPIDFWHDMQKEWVITMTSQWPWWRLRSPASRLFTQPFIRARIKENIKAPRHWPLCGEFTGDQWILRTNGQ